MPTAQVVLSHFQIAPILQARAEGTDVVSTSLDLGRTTSKVVVEATRVLLPGGESLTWDAIGAIARSELACFKVEKGQAVKIERFSEFLNRYYSLMPTLGAPTLLVSGIAMHRVKGITPDRDTLNKIRVVAPKTGKALDTCTGLGYTAIELSRSAQEVVTIELDPVVLEIARLNPWSQRLFDNPRLTQIVGDAYDEIAGFEDEAFSRIVHDPPMFSLAGELYSRVFYQQLFRVLGRRGRLFHYIGNLESRSGRTVTRGVVRRLQEAGFSRVVRKPEAFGLVAYK
jgi:predicted methyltransferase